MREPPAERAKHQKLKLSQMETDPILNNRMLPDGSINIAQDNLNKQFPEFAGFYDTIPDVPCVKVLSEVHPDSLFWRSSLGLHHQSRWPLLFIFVHGIYFMTVQIVEKYLTGLWLHCPSVKMQS